MIPGLGGRRESTRVVEGDGRFEIGGLSAGKWKVAASTEGYTPCEPVEVVLPRAEGALPIELVLERAGSVSGIVLGTEGLPAPGAQVQLEIGLDEIFRTMRDESGPLSVRAGDDGRFVLNGLGAGKRALVASSDGFAESAAVEVEISPDTEVRDIVLRLRTGGRITGEVYGDDGSPIAGAQIMNQSSADPLNQAFANADAQGRFEFQHVVPGTFNVMYFPLAGMKAPDGDASAADFTAMFSSMKMTTATVADGEEVHVVLGAPPADPVQVHGRVHCDGQGVGGLVITFIRDGSKSMSGLKFVTTDSEGRYSVRLDEPGHYVASVQKPGMAGQQQTVAHTLDVPKEPDYEHDIALPVGSITGTVVDAEGHPAKGARVSLSADGPVPNGTLVGEHYAEISTDDAGRYELVWLREGHYSVGVGGAPFGGLFGGVATSGRQVRTGIEVREGQRTDGVDFRLHAPGKITGLVHGSDGRAVAEAAIFLRDAAGRTLERFSMVATDSAGRFSYDGLEPGEYSVIARTSSETSNSNSTVRVEEGKSAEVELALSAGTVLIVALTSDDGSPLDCSVVVEDEHGRQVNGTMSLTEIMQAFSSGQFSSKEQRVGPLSPGKYKVTVSTNDGRKTTKPVTLTGQPERKLNVKL